MRLSLLAALVAALLFTACSSDDISSDARDTRPVTFNLTLAANDGGEASSATRRMTRATWNYDSDDQTYNGKENYVEGEGIYSWFVLMVNDDRTIEHVFTGSNLKNVEQDAVTISDGNGGTTTTITTDPGAKTFYNFANLSQLEVATAAGLVNDAGTTTDATVFSGTAFVEGGTLTPEQLAALDNATYAMNALGYKPTATNPIPMSGKQNYDLTWTDHYGQTLTLWVVRMLAKLELQFTNATGNDVTVNSVTIAPITANATTTTTTTTTEGTTTTTTTTDNIMLFPKHTDPSAGLTQLPSLTTAATNTSDPLPNSSITLAANATDATTLTLYLNESQLPADNIYKEYALTLSLTVSGDGVTNTQQQRYTLISDNSDNEWTYIARNDYRVIPITIQDYKLTLTPYDYPPIGVLPSSVQEADGTFTCTFHAGGDFHLVPTVTSYATGTAVTVGYTDGAFENIELSDASGNLLTTTDTESGTTVPAWSTLFSTTPVWADSWDMGNTYGETGALIHGTFQYGLTSSYTSRHRLTVKIAPTDGSTTARTFSSPVILKYVP